MKIFHRRIPLTVLVCLMTVALVKPAAAATDSGSQCGSDSIFVHKKMISRSHRIGLYPDALHQALFFTVRGVEGRVYQLYVFDMDGKLIRQSEIRNKQTTFISNIEKGVYLFDVFCDDDKIGNGKIAVR